MAHPTLPPTSDSPVAPDGRPWWKPRTWPHRNQPMGGQHRAAAYLWFQKAVGEAFSMRELRKHGWRFDSYKDRQGQATDSYLLVEKGARTWLGERREVDAVSAAVRRLVLDRDGNRCVVCGVGAAEPYPEDPDSRARMTIGRRRAGARLADASPDNLQAECARCNEPSGDAIPDPETLDAVMASMRRLGAKDRRDLLAWIAAKHWGNSTSRRQFRASTEVGTRQSDGRALITVSRLRFVSELRSLRLTFRSERR